MAVLTETDGGRRELKKTACYMCTNNCAVDLWVEDDRAVAVEGNLCPKGRANLASLNNPQRLLYPLRRRGERGSGEWERIAWDDALDEVAAKLTKVKAAYGPEAVIFFIGYAKEPRPFYERLTHAFGSPNYMTESSTCFSATYVAARLTYGYPYFLSTGKPEPATQCLLVWSANPAAAHHYETDSVLAVQKKSGRLIVVDPRATELAAQADIHLQLRPGTDGALALAFGQVIIEEGLYDREFVGRWTHGFAEYCEYVKQFTPERAAEITGVPAAKIRQAARLYATARPAKIHSSASAVVHTSNAAQNFRAVITLAGLTGNFDVPGGNKLPPKTTWLYSPAGIPLNDITLQDSYPSLPPRIGQETFPVWTELYHEANSNTLPEVVATGRPYPVKAFYGIGPNAMMWPRSSKYVEALRQLDFVAVSDFYHTSLTGIADIVLPVAHSFERRTLKVGGNGFIQLIEPAVAPRGECRSDVDVIFDLAVRLGLGDEFWQGDYEACLRHILAPSGLSLDELKAHPAGMRVPVETPPAKSYEQNGFPTPTGKMEIASTVLERHGFPPLPVYEEPAESPLSTPELAREYPLVLTTGARLLEYTHSQHRHNPELRRLQPAPRLDLNPADARSRNIGDGDPVVLRTPRGEITVKANLTPVVPAGVVNMFHGWSETNVNELIADDQWDPISGFPPFKAQLCQVEKVALG